MAMVDIIKPGVDLLASSLTQLRVRGTEYVVLKTVGGSQQTHMLPHL